MRARRTPQVTSRRTAATSPAAAKKIRAYWTKDRMRSATPKVIARPARPGGGAAAMALRDRGEGQAHASARWRLLGPRDGSSKVVQTTGKVFFTEGNANYVCSGGAVTSAKRAAGSPPRGAASTRARVRCHQLPVRPGLQERRRARYRRVGGLGSCSPRRSGRAPVASTTTSAWPRSRRSIARR